MSNLLSEILHFKIIGKRTILTGIRQLVKKVEKKKTRKKWCLESRCNACSRLKKDGTHERSFHYSSVIEMKRPLFHQLTASLSCTFLGLLRMGWFPVNFHSNQENVSLEVLHSVWKFTQMSHFNFDDFWWKNSNVFNLKTDVGHFRMNSSIFHDIV